MRLLIGPNSNIMYTLKVSADWIKYSAETFIYINPIGTNVFNDKIKVVSSFSTTKMDDNKWYAYFIVNNILYNRKIPRLIKATKPLTEDNMMELKLRFDKALVISCSGQGYTQQGIIYANYISDNQDFRITTLLDHTDFDCIVFIKSCEEAIINHIQDHYGIKHYVFS